MASQRVLKLHRRRREGEYTELADNGKQSERPVGLGRLADRVPGDVKMWWQGIQQNWGGWCGRRSHTQPSVHPYAPRSLFRTSSPMGGPSPNSLNRKSTPSAVAVLGSRSRGRTNVSNCEPKSVWLPLNQDQLKVLSPMQAKDRAQTVKLSPVRLDCTGGRW